MNSVYDVADDGEDEEQEDYYDGDDEVAADHCLRGGVGEEKRGDPGVVRDKGVKRSGICVR